MSLYLLGFVIIAALVLLGFWWVNRQAYYNEHSGRKGYAVVLVLGIAAWVFWSQGHTDSKSQKSAKALPAASGATVSQPPHVQPAASPVVVVPAPHRKALAVHAMRHAKAVQKQHRRVAKKVARHAPAKKATSPPVASQVPVRLVVHHYYVAPRYIAPAAPVYRSVVPAATHVYVTPLQPKAPEVRYIPPVQTPVYHPVAPIAQPSSPAPAKPPARKKVLKVWALGG
jgi:hypothetical protein